MAEPGDETNNKSGIARWRELLQNRTSIIGLAVALVALGNIVFLFFIDLTSKRPSPYVGILAYMVAPGFLIFGLVLIGVGIWYDYRQRRAPGQAPALRLDFSDPSQKGPLHSF